MKASCTQSSGARQRARAMSSSDAACCCHSRLSSVAVINRLPSHSPAFSRVVGSLSLRRYDATITQVSHAAQRILKLDNEPALTKRVRAIRKTLKNSHAHTCGLPRVGRFLRNRQRFVRAAKRIRTAKQNRVVPQTWGFCNNRDIGN